ncbi:MAG: hypothetical protein WC291_06290 [Thermodesulfovibrionales bacterium]|jgi:hypothetical protein
MDSPDFQIGMMPSWQDKERWGNFLQRLSALFERDTCLRDVKYLAYQVKKLTEEIDPLIQEFTSAVCPSCREVCCINRHGYYALDDLIYICGLGLEPPQYREGVEDTAPCQFLGQGGCVFERSVRPFRCNWYFCTPLLNHMDSGSARKYREFTRRFTKIQEKRKEMLGQFFSLSRRLL